MTTIPISTPSTKPLKVMVLTILFMLSLVTSLNAYEITIDSELSDADKAYIAPYLECGKAVCLTWVDPATGLMWQKEPYSQKEVEAYGNNNNYGKAGNWQYAKRYCANLDYAGYSDWRLPTIEELKTLLSIKDYFEWGRDGELDELKAWAKNNKHRRSRSNNGKDYFIIKQILNSMPPHPKGYAAYWSSTGHASSSDGAWIVGFDDGSTYGYSKSYSFFVRCVL